MFLVNAVMSPEPIDENLGVKGKVHRESNRIKTFTYNTRRKENNV